MKKKKIQKEMMQLSEEIRGLCGFGGKDPLGVRAVRGVCVIHKKEMNVLELAQLIETLSELAGNLTVQLAAAAGMCDGCGNLGEKNPNQYVAECRLCSDILDEGQNICVPDYLLEEAGITVGSKLEAYADGDTSAIVVVEAEEQQDITSFPSGVLNVLKASGVCLAELDELIVQGTVIYGE